MTAGLPGGRPESADVREVRANLNRAMRRLNVLELVLLGAAAVAAVGGGWLAALLGAKAFDLPFRATWMTASLALFIIPAAIALGVERLRRRTAGKAGTTTGTRSTGEAGQ